MMNATLHEKNYQQACMLRCDEKGQKEAKSPGREMAKNYESSTFKQKISI